jgi:hypothetical protein
MRGQMHILPRPVGKGSQRNMTDGDGAILSPFGGWDKPPALQYRGCGDFVSLQPHLCEYNRANPIAHLIPITSTV